jgi:hypothetical protein
MQRRVRLLMSTVAVASVLSSVGVTIGASGPPADLTRQVVGGGVTVAATLLTDRTDVTAIRLVLNTHSVNLDGYQFDTIAMLRDDKGKTYALEAVESASGSGHHRQAVLRFARADAGAKAMELVVKDVAGVKERTLRWSMAN